ncbi:MAG: division plane positioning ATPase MipZ [Alphaproteobacteria bacterium]
MLDLKRGGGGSGGPSLTLSHVAARQEVRDIVSSLNLPAVAPAPLDELVTEEATPALPPAG